MFKKICLICLALFLSTFAGMVASGMLEKNSSEAAAAQRLKAFDALPLCGGKDPAQTALDKGGACRPI